MATRRCTGALHPLLNWVEPRRCASGCFTLPCFCPCPLQGPIFDGGWAHEWHGDEECGLPSPDGAAAPGGSQHEQQRAASQGGATAAWRYAAPPPTSEELAATCWARGVPPVVAPQAHYSRPQDAPAQATVFAGLAFRVPTSAVVELPAFQSGAAPEALQLLQQRQRAQLWGEEAAGLPLPGAVPRRGQLLAYVPACPPPSRAATDAWLAARSRRRRGGPARSSSGAELAMDPNTGRLMPAAGGGAGDAAARLGGGEGQGTPASALLGDADLLATPSLCSLGSGGGDGGDRPGTPTSRVPAMPASTAAALAGEAAQQDQAGPGGASDDEGEGAEEPEARRGRRERELQCCGVAAPVSLADGAPTPAFRRRSCAPPFPLSVQVRPPSPKYEEPVFTNPFPSIFLGGQPPPPATARRPRVGGGAAATPAGDDGTPRPQQQQQQQQRPSRLGLAAGSQEKEQPSAEGSAGGSGQAGSAPPQAQRPPDTLLKRVLRSALKEPGRSSQDEGPRPLRLDAQLLQGSEGSGKRVSFAGGSSQEGTPSQAALTPAPPAEPPAAEQQRQQQHPATAGPAPSAGGDTLAPGALETQRASRRFVSQITPPSPGGASAGTPLSQAGFKQRRCVAGKGQQLTLLSVEVHADSR